MISRWKYLNLLVRVACSAPLAASCLLASCTAYDADLVSGPKQQGVSVMPASASPAASGGSLDAGISADVVVPEQEAAAPASTASEVHCGDGRVTGEEKCDIGIAAGMPGACPTECPPLAACNPRALNNSGCQAECVLLQLVCMSGDGCCPGMCTDRNDSDCSSHCGDGVLQPEAGETCEVESSTPCKRSDAECNDGDPCTQDKLVGSPRNCNALCTNTRITSPQAGDACCPEGADANSDSDCKPVCGNKIREAGEDCDGTTGCNTSCKVTLQEPQVQCLEKLGETADDCAKCSCMNCQDSYTACADNADATAAMRCMAILECARKNDCFGTACYCGDAFLCAAPNGKCRAEIEAAAGSTDTNVISMRANDTTSALGKAYAADTCRNQQCMTQCR